MKMIAGAFLRAVSKSLRMREAPRPGEHLDEGGRALRVEARARLVGDRLREQRLAGAGRPVEEEALRDARAEPREPLRVAEEVDDLLELGLRVLDAGDVRERHRRLRVRLGHLRLDPRHQLDRPPDQDDEDREEDDRQPGERTLADLVRQRRERHAPFHRQSAGRRISTLSGMELPLPPHWDPARVEDVWRVPYDERAAEADAWARAARHRPARDDDAAGRPAARRLPEHVLHAGLRAVRSGSARRQPAALRVRLPQPRRDHADRPDARHAPRDAGLPRRLARRRGRAASRRRTRSSRPRTSRPASGGRRTRPSRAHLIEYVRGAGGTAAATG